MSKQIHVLDQNFGEQGTRTIKCVFWFSITQANRQIPMPAFKSAAPVANVSTQDQADLESGALREEIVYVSFPSSYTTTQMKAEINARYTDKGTSIAAEPAVRQFYGVFYDSSTGWSA